MQEPARPLPAMTPQPITMDQYEALIPEKLELWEGYLIRGANDHAARRNLLLLLLMNEGLDATVGLAPADSWREALQRVYGAP